MDIFTWRFINNGIFTVFNVGMMGIMVNINGDCPIVDDDHACFQWDIDHFFSPSNGLNGREPVGSMFFLNQFLCDNYINSVKESR